jgi:hypothetical protein
MYTVDERVTRLGFWTLLLGWLAAVAPTGYPGYWQGREGFTPVFNAVTSSALASVATAPDLWRGTGRAAFLLVQPLITLGATPVVAVRAMFALALLMGGLGVYTWLRTRLGDRGAGLAGLVYVLLPPVLGTIYVRGSLADALVLALLPLALAGLASFAESRSPAAAGVVVLGLLWMWRVQAGLAVHATLLLLVYAPVVERSWWGLVVVGVTALAGVVSLIPLWGVSAPPPVAFAEQFANLGQYLYRGGQDVYPLHLGPAALGLGMMSLWLWRLSGADRSRRYTRLLAFCAGGAGVALALGLGVAAPLWALTRGDRLLTYPWQVTLLAMPLVAALAGSAVTLLPWLQRAALWLALAAAMLLSSAPYLTAGFTQVTPPRAPVAVFGADNDLVVLAATLTESPAAARLDVTWQVQRPLGFDYNVFFQALDVSGEEPRVVDQVDVQPLQGTAPATTWTPGIILSDTYTVTLLPDEFTRPLHYYFGFYDWRNGARLPVDGGLDDKLVLYGN